MKWCTSLFLQLCITLTPFEILRRDTINEIQDYCLVAFLTPVEVQRPESKEKQLFGVMTDYQFCCDNIRVSFHFVAQTVFLII